MSDFKHNLTKQCRTLLDLLSNKSQNVRVGHAKWYYVDWQAFKRFAKEERPCLTCISLHDQSTHVEPYELRDINVCRTCAKRRGGPKHRTQNEDEMLLLYCCCDAKSNKNRTKKMILDNMKLEVFDGENWKLVVPYIPISKKRQRAEFKNVELAQESNKNYKQHVLETNQKLRTDPFKDLWDFYEDYEKHENISEPWNLPPSAICVSEQVPPQLEIHKSVSSPLEALPSVTQAPLPFTQTSPVNHKHLILNSEFHDLKKDFDECGNDRWLVVTVVPAQVRRLQAAISKRCLIVQLERAFLQATHFEHCRWQHDSGIQSILKMKELFPLKHTQWTNAFDVICVEDVHRFRQTHYDILSRFLEANPNCCLRLYGSQRSNDTFFLKPLSEFPQFDWTMMNILKKQHWVTDLVRFICQRNIESFQEHLIIQSDRAPCVIEKSTVSSSFLAEFARMYGILLPFLYSKRFMFHEWLMNAVLTADCWIYAPFDNLLSRYKILVHTLNQYPCRANTNLMGLPLPKLDIVFLIACHCIDLARNDKQLQMSIFNSAVIFTSCDWLFEIWSQAEVCFDVVGLQDQEYLLKFKQFDLSGIADGFSRENEILELKFKIGTSWLMQEDVLQTAIYLLFDQYSQHVIKDHAVLYNYRQGLLIRISFQNRDRFAEFISHQIQLYERSINLR